MFHQFRAGQIRVPLIRFEVFTGALFQLIVVAVQGIEALQKRFFPLKNLHMAFVAVGTDDLVQIRSAVLDLFLVFGTRGVAGDLLTAERRCFDHQTRFFLCDIHFISHQQFSFFCLNGIVHCFVHWLLHNHHDKTDGGAAARQTAYYGDNRKNVALVSVCKHKSDNKNDGRKDEQSQCHKQSFFLFPADIAVIPFSDLHSSVISLLR